VAEVEWERRGAVLVVSLNRPEKKNAIGGATFRLLLEAYREAAADDEIRAVVTTGRGGTFSVGADAATLKAVTGPPGHVDRGGSDNGLPPLSYSGAEVDRLGPGRWALEVLTLAKPTVAAVEGAAAGGGFCLALLHDFRVASADARFVAGFVAMGLAPELGASYLLPRLVGMPAARRMLVCNERLSATDALACGLVDAVAPAGSSTLDAALELAGRLAQAPPLAVGMTLNLLAASGGRSLVDQMEAEYAAQRQLFGTEDHREAVAAFTERRPASFAGR
jgi:2-(1,2-epoxy-1,2-dihydrophenyl)acetyl-CoA isomerase